MQQLHCLTYRTVLTAGLIVHILYPQRKRKKRAKFPFLSFFLQDYWILSKTKCLNKNKSYQKTVKLKYYSTVHQTFGSAGFSCKTTHTKTYDPVEGWDNVCKCLLLPVFSYFPSILLLGTQRSISNPGRQIQTTWENNHLKMSIWKAENDTWQLPFLLTEHLNGEITFSIWQSLHRIPLSRLWEHWLFTIQPFENKDNIKTKGSKEAKIITISGNAWWT